MHHEGGDLGFQAHVFGMLIEGMAVTRTIRVDPELLRERRCQGQ